MLPEPLLLMILSTSTLFSFSPHPDLWIPLYLWNIIMSGWNMEHTRRFSSTPSSSSYRLGKNIPNHKLRKSATQTWTQISLCHQRSSSLSSSDQTKINPSHAYKRAPTLLPHPLRVLHLTCWCFDDMMLAFHSSHAASLTDWQTLMSVEKIPVVLVLCVRIYREDTNVHVHQDFKETHHPFRDALTLMSVHCLRMANHCAEPMLRVSTLLVVTFVGVRPDSLVTRVSHVSVSWESFRM